MDFSDRKFVISALSTICVFFLLLEILNIILGETTIAYIWGLPVGILLGIGYSLLFSEKWDPVNLRLKELNNSSTKIRWTWSVPLGVIVANILLSFFDSQIADLIMGVLGGWLYTFLAYVILQLWWRRPK